MKKLVSIFCCIISLQTQATTLRPSQAEKIIHIKVSHRKNDNNEITTWRNIRAACYATLISCASAIKACCITTYYQPAPEPYITFKHMVWQLSPIPEEAPKVEKMT